MGRFFLNSEIERVQRGEYADQMNDVADYMLALHINVRLHSTLGICQPIFRNNKLRKKLSWRPRYLDHYRLIS
jgi:hypothetical protein